MIEQLSKMQTPTWLLDIVNNDSMHEIGLPLADILTDSLYYPACGLDGTPLKFLGGNIVSFVYADYGVSKEDYLEDIHSQDAMKGYERIAEREIFRNEIIPEGWVPPLLPGQQDGNLEALKSWQGKCTPFGHWSIWKQVQNSEGAEYLSLLYLGGEACAIYQGLYNRLKITPKIVAIIQPGDSLGGGWGVIQNNDKFFKKVVAQNSKGLPEYLLHGGIGGAESYKQPCWQEYQGRQVVQLPVRYAGLWKFQN